MSTPNVVEMIRAKRHGLEHDRAELEDLITAYVAGEVPDYQVSAWLMAVCWRGMTDAETAALTSVMANSGHVLDLGGLPHTVDKHSTGGVGDKTSLVVTPLLAAMGGTVAKMSGRGLGHTGGTVDKLESIPGFRSSLSDDEFLEQARTVGLVVTGQSKELAPADGLLYALRDATATVDSLPLIASSIMSKKLAGGASSLVLDVKVGAGAFLPTLEAARDLARAMLAIGTAAGRNVRAVISAMDQPLGLAVGNAVEVAEAVACLRGEGPDDLLELSLTLAEAVLGAAGLPATRASLLHAVKGGAALAKFEEWVAAQGGRLAEFRADGPGVADEVVTAPRGGHVTRLDAMKVARAAHVLGAGRSRKGESIDHMVGVLLHAKVGDPVTEGQPLATVRHRAGRGLPDALAHLKSAFELGENATRPPLVLELLGG